MMMHGIKDRFQAYASKVFISVSREWDVVYLGLKFGTDYGVMI
jgi:hypothetical protein